MGVSFLCSILNVVLGATVPALLLSTMNGAAAAAAAAAAQKPSGQLFEVAVSTTTLRGSGATLAVSVSGPQVQNGSHFLGMFFQDANLSAVDPRYRKYCPPGGCAETTPPWTATAPIKFWSLNNGKRLSSFSVHVINYRQPLHFVVCDNGLNEQCVGSPVVSFERMLCEPTGVHLARTATADELRVTWQSGEQTAALRWRLVGEAVWKVIHATSSTYSQSQMCGIPANMSIGWSDPGWIHSAVFSSGGVAAEYSVGSVACTSEPNAPPMWSPIYSVASTPRKSATVMLIGDMGEAPRDHPGSSHHWQMPQPTEVIDAMVLRASGNSGDYDAILHIGDLSYATGYTSIWDGFMRQIEPLATKIPYFTSPGNHERDSPGTGAFQRGDDSGGECGVPFNARFIMPAGDIETPTPAQMWSVPPKRDGNNPDPRAPFYSSNIGPMHVIFASTEHNYHPGSAQHEWILRDLGQVNRARTPFVVFSGHRPMYSSVTVGESAPPPYHVAENASYNWQMGAALEPLFEQYGVDIAYWGHVHNYERTCAIHNLTCQMGGKGTVHVTAGTGGASVTVFPTYNRTSGRWSARKCPSNSSMFGPTCSKCKDVTTCAAGSLPCVQSRCEAPPAWSLARSEEHGFVQLFVNYTHLRSEFIAVDTDQVGNVGIVHDSVTLVARNSHR